MRYLNRVEWIDDRIGDRIMEIDRDRAESIVSSDLKKRYPDIERLEFTHARFSEILKEWWVMGWFLTESGSIRFFSYTLDAETGWIKEYTIAIIKL